SLWFGQPLLGRPTEGRWTAATGGAPPPMANERPLTAKQQELAQVTRDLAEARRQWHNARDLGRTGQLLRPFSDELTRLLRRQRQLETDLRPQRRSAQGQSAQQEAEQWFQTRALPLMRPAP